MSDTCRRIRKAGCARIFGPVGRGCVLSLAVICCMAGPLRAADTLTMFQQAWTDFDRNYSYFTYKDIDWDAVKNAYQGNFEDELTAEQFAVQLGDMLQVLHDWHVYVEAPGGALYGYDGAYSENGPSQPRNAYTLSGYEQLGDAVIRHAWVLMDGDENIGYIRIDTLDTDRFSTISDADIEALFSTYADADGMIVDIRRNGGGNENNAARIASRFTEETRVYGYTKTRVPGDDHDVFGDLVAHSLDPASGTRFTGPAALLIGQHCMSSAEWFTLMMRACPNVTLIGATTRGASANPALFSLENGVSFTVSSWIAYTDDMVAIEDTGIAPDIAIPADESLDGSHDYVLERAIVLLSGAEPSTTTSAAPSTTTTTSVGPFTTTTSTGADTTTTMPSGEEFALAAQPSSGPAPLSVAFSCTADPPAQSYDWDFGDGSTWQTTQVPQTSHEYTSPGYYLAFVTAYYDETAFDMASVEINVSGEGDGDCPLETLYAGRDARLDRFRRVRDRLLATGGKARQYVNLYYRHAEEIGAVLDQKPLLALQASLLAESALLCSDSILSGAAAPCEQRLEQGAAALIDRLLPLVGDRCARDLAGLQEELDAGVLSKLSGPAVQPPVRQQ